MRLPLSSTDEGAFYERMRQAPFDSLPRLVLADWREEHNSPLRAEILRRVEDLRDRLTGSLRLARPDALELLRRTTLVEETCKHVLDQLKDVLQQADSSTLTQEQLIRFETTLSAAVGTPSPAETLDLRQPEHVKLRYDLQRTLLASLDLLEIQDCEEGITGIDGRFHLLPSLENIQRRLHAPGLQRKIEQGFGQLCLVPFALPFKSFLDAWRRGLLRSEHLLQEAGGLDRTQPLYVWNAYDQEENLVYRPEHFTASHSGRTKRQLLQEGHPGWDILLVEGDLLEIPSEGQGTTVGRRPQITCSQTSEAYLRALSSDEIGWTPETYILHFLSTLEQRGQVLDQETYTYLIGAFLPSSRDVPGAYWDRYCRRARLSGSHPDYRLSSGGARVAVRVV
jgi:uncharacterized protein (TIGR02996 family)